MIWVGPKKVSFFDFWSKIVLVRINAEYAVLEGSCPRTQHVPAQPMPCGKRDGNTHASSGRAPKSWFSTMFIAKNNRCRRQYGHFRWPGCRELEEYITIACKNIRTGKWSQNYDTFSMIANPLLGARNWWSGVQIGQTRWNPMVSLVFLSKSTEPMIWENFSKITISVQTKSGTDDREF